MGEIDLSRRVSLGVLLTALLAPGLPARGAGAEIRVEPPSIDFGERGQNERPEATLRLRNPGSQPLWIRELKKSCDCISLTPARFNGPIPAGESVDLKVSMGSGRAMGRLEKHISILTGSPGQPEVSVPVAMRVLDDFEMLPFGGVRFEGVQGGKPERATVEIKVRPGRRASLPRLEVKEIRSLFNRPSGRYLQAVVQSRPGAQEIVIQLDPRHPEGPISADLEATLDGKCLIIPIGGEVFAWIKVSPNYLNFSRALEDDPSSTRREVGLTSTDGTPFKVLELEARPQRPGEKLVRLELSAEPQAPSEGGASTVQKIVCRAVRGEGSKTAFYGTVTIRTDHPRKPELSLKYSGFFDEKKP